MANQISRVTGQVLSVKERTGTNSETGKDWAMTLANVLVGSHGTTELILPYPAEIAKTIGQVPKRGDHVDWVIETRNGKKGYNTSILGLYEDDLV